MRFWPRWGVRHIEPLPPDHAESVREADRRMQEITRQRQRVAELEDVLTARRKANRFSAAVQEALGGRPWK